MIAVGEPLHEFLVLSEQQEVSGAAEHFADLSHRDRLIGRL